MDAKESQSLKEKEQRSTSNRLKSYGAGCVFLLFAISWVLMAWYVLVDIRSGSINPFSYIDPFEYSRWVLSPDSSRTAVLVRDYYFDLNFRLFIVDPHSKEIPRDVKQAIWTSRDYPLSDYQEFDDDIHWSRDSAVVAVTIDDEFVFAYDFGTSQEFREPDEIISLLKEHNNPAQSQD
jgi:hypothetical protein